MKIRQFTTHDEEDVTAIILAVRSHYKWPTDVEENNPTQARAWLHGRDTIDQLVAVKENNIVGYGCSYRIPPDDPALGLWEKATGVSHTKMGGLGGGIVHPKNRRQGIGEQLLEVFVQKLVTKRLVPVTATISPQAEQLLYNVGFTKVGLATSAQGDKVSVWAVC